jgi:hypothetical protein
MAQHHQLLPGHLAYRNCGVWQGATQGATRAFRFASPIRATPTADAPFQVRPNALSRLSPLRRFLMHPAREIRNRNYGSQLRMMTLVT